MFNLCYYSLALYLKYNKLKDSSKLNDYQKLSLARFYDINLLNPCLIIILVFIPSQIFALRQDHFDLASLVLKSEYVVLAECSSQSPLKNWGYVTKFIVKKV